MSVHPNPEIDALVALKNALCLIIDAKIKELNLEHQEWKSLRDYEFCKHEEEDDESPY